MFEKGLGIISIFVDDDDDDESTYIQAQHTSGGSHCYRGQNYLKN